MPSGIDAMMSCTMHNLSASCTDLRDFFSNVCGERYLIYRLLTGRDASFKMVSGFLRTRGRNSTIIFIGAPRPEGSQVGPWV